jgi:hypothetical protein
MSIASTRIEIDRPHTGQVRVMRDRKRFNVIRCGRRWGKTTFGEIVGCETALAGQNLGWFAPTYKYLLEPWRDFCRILRPAIASKNEQEKRIELVTGGVIDFWSTDTDDPARGRKYHRVVVDECGIMSNLLEVWMAAIRPTLTDYRGDAFFLGTPKGRRQFAELFARGEQGREDWASFAAKTIENPRIDPAEIEAARRDLPEDVFRQEFEGIPADDGGNPFGMAAIAECVAPMSKEKPIAFGVDLAKSHDWVWVIGLDEQWRVCVSERWQADWRTTRERINAIIGTTPASIDSTGVGDPIVEDLQRVGNYEGFKFTQQSKQQIMEGLASKIQQRAIGFPDGILRSELESFEYEYTRTGVRYTAPTGLHDDGVCALALAVHARARCGSRSFGYRWIEI